MKKLLRFLTIALVTGVCTCSWAIDYNNHFYNQRVYRVALGSGVAPTAADMNAVYIHNGDMVLNTDDDCLYIMHATNVYTKMTSAGAVTVTDFTPSTLTVSGKSTLNGELEVNNSDVDINMTLTGNEIDIAQTNATGTADVPLVKITDARTGATANTPQEATLFVYGAGTYAIVISNGILQVKDEIDTLAGDLTLDPAGSEVLIDGGVHIGGTSEPGDNNLLVDGTAEVTGVATFTSESVHNGGIDADYITVDANLGINSKTAGPLQIGTNTTTSINYGSAAVTVHTFLTDGTGTGEIVLPNESIGNAELASGIDAAKLLTASIASAIDGSVITNIPDAGITSLSAAKLTAGTIASAIDGSSITNLGADKIASGTLDNARLDADLQPLALDDGGGLTNLNGSSVASGTVADARLSSALQAVAANNGTALTGVVANSMSAAGLIAATVASAIDGSAITNLNGSSIASGTVPNARLDTDLQPLAEDDGGGLTNIVSDGIISLSAAKLQAATVASAIDISACTNLPDAGITGLSATKLTVGSIASAIDGSAITNFAGGNIASGDIAAARIATALGTSGGSIGGNIPIAAITNALSATLYSGTYTNVSTLSTNTITVLNGVTVSVTSNP